MTKMREMEDLTAGIILDEYESLYRMAYTYVHNESDAMDIVQESAYKAITKCQTVKPRYLKTWIYEVLLNNDSFLSIRIRTETSEASSHSYSRIYNINKKAGKIMKLGSLFRKKLMSRWRNSKNFCLTEFLPDVIRRSGDCI